MHFKFSSAKKESLGVGNWIEAPALVHTVRTEKHFPLDLRWQIKAWFLQHFIK